MMLAFPLRAVRYAAIGAFCLIVVWLLNPFGSTSSSPLSRSKVRFKKSSFDWSKVKRAHPKLPLTPLPPGKPRSLPRIQYNFAGWEPDHETISRRKEVRDAFIRSWNSYKKHAWLQDELTPVSGGGKKTLGGWAATMVDTLDTLWIMDLKDDFYEAANAAANMDWADTTETGLNLFETTTRHLGGLISAYDLSGERALLQKATELGEMLLMAFDTPNGIPAVKFSFQAAREGSLEAGDWEPSAGPCSLSVEFTRLAQLTGQQKFYDAVDAIIRFLERTQDKTSLPGMWPRMIDFQAEDVSLDHGFTLGALSDSLYEYFPKMYALLGGLDDSYAKLYRKSMDAVVKHLLFRPMVPGGENILFAGYADAHPDGGVEMIPDGQHLACFVGGMFGLGGRLFNIIKHVEIGERLARGCAWAYDAFPTGLMPEEFAMVPCESIDRDCTWDEERWKHEAEGKTYLPKGFKNARDPRYVLRPEAIESVFLLYRITGKKDLQDIAWQMFQSIMNSTKTDLANSAIASVNAEGETNKLDSMETFWLSETLKYFYLIFSSPDLISLDEFVFNTEAHPFRRPK